MKRYIKIFISATLAGLILTIAGLAYLAVRQFSSVLAAFMFSFGLFSIITFNLYLYTGKIGYVIKQQKSYYFDLLVCLLGNAFGAIASGYIVYACKDGSTTLKNMYLTAVELSNNKLSPSVGVILLLSFLCGIMVYIAVEVNKKEIHPLFKLVAIFFAVTIFVICGFEHCIGDMVYFSIANAWSFKTFGYILMMILGNSIGSLFINFLLKQAEKLNVK